MCVKLWDLRNASNMLCSRSRPIYSAQVTDYMERNLSLLHENDCLTDQFFLDVSPDGKYFSTGGYNRSAHVIDIQATTNTTVNCNFKAERDQPAGKLKVYSKNKKITGPPSSEKVDTKKRV